MDKHFSSISHTWSGCRPNRDKDGSLFLVLLLFTLSSLPEWPNNDISLLKIMCLPKFSNIDCLLSEDLISTKCNSHWSFPKRTTWWLQGWLRKWHLVSPFYPWCQSKSWHQKEPNHPLVSIIPCSPWVWRHRKSRVVSLVSGKYKLLGNSLVFQRVGS